MRSLRAMESYKDSVNRPFIQLVDGGVSDNVGIRAVLDALEILEALQSAGVPIDNFSFEAAELPAR